MKKRLTLFLFALSCSFIAFAQAPVWSAMGTGLNNYSDAMAFYNGELYAGGVFNAADGNSATNIAKWNGSSWSAVGSGVNNYVYAMVVYHHQLYVAGQFTNAGGLPARRIARWNGVSWDTVGHGINGLAVYSMTVHNDKLYVGGKFGQAGYTTVSNIAVWNDTSWSAVGNGFASFWGSTEVDALQSFQGELYAGGWFQIAGTDSTCSNIAKWNGSSWMHVGDGVDGKVLSLCASGTKLYLGGAFSYTTNNYPAKHFASWNGSIIQSVGGGVNNTVYAITPYGSNVYLGGRFTQVGSSPAGHIASWDGSTFSALGNGTDTTVRAIAADDGIIYASGDFVHASSVTVNYIGKFSETGVGMAESFSASDISVYPNPSNGIFRFFFGEIPGTKTIEISDATGRLVRTIQTSDQKTEIDLSGEAKGIYFCRIFSQKQLIGTKKILLN